MPSPTHFIGYGSLENLVAETTPNAVSANLVEETSQPGKYGLYLNRLYAVVSVLDHKEHVHYCRISLGNIQMVNGNPLSRDEQIKERAQGGFKIIKAWLQDQGCRVSPSVVAIPRNLKLLDGQACFLAYDKESDRFYKREEVKS